MDLLSKTYRKTIKLTIAGTLHPTDWLKVRKADTVKHSLLSAGASLAYANPEVLKKAIPQPECGESPEKGTNVKVTLYDTDLKKHEFSIPIKNATGEFTVKGLTREGTGWSWTEGSWVWPGILEAAYEELTGDRTAYIDAALTAVQGKKAEVKEINGQGWKETVLELASKHGMVTQTATDDSETKDFFHGHAYSILSANDTHVIMRNPWGATLTADPSVPETAQDLSDDPDWGPSVFAIPIERSDGPGTFFEQSNSLTIISYVA